MPRSSDMIAICTVPRPVNNHRSYSVSFTTHSMSSSCRLGTLVDDRSEYTVDDYFSLTVRNNDDALFPGVGANSVSDSKQI